MSTATAIHSTLEGIREGNNYVAVLDLKGAYDRMPRNLLCQRLDISLPPWLANMVKYFLQRSFIWTAGDASKTFFSVNKGVAQGSPLSPTLYKIFMDSLAGSLEKIPRAFSTSPTTIYADEVVVRARSAQGLQALLDI